MAITVNKQEFCDRVAELVALVEGGAEVVLQQPGKPELKLTAEKSLQAGEKPRREWVFDMHPGGYIAPDFADPLPDEYWEGTL